MIGEGNTHSFDTLWIIVYRTLRVAIGWVISKIRSLGRRSEPGQKNVEGSRDVIAVRPEGRNRRPELFLGHGGDELRQHEV